MKTTYEWDIETIDTEHGDVLDHHHHDKLSDLLDTLKRQALSLASRPLSVKQAERNYRYEIVLVRDVGSDAEGVVDRQWWYPGCGQCERFGEGYGGTKVPKKHLAEYARHAEELRKALNYLNP